MKVRGLIVQSVLGVLVVLLIASSAPAQAENDAPTAWFNQEKIRFGWGQWYRHQRHDISVERMMINASRAGITVFVDAWKGVDQARMARKHGMRYMGNLMVTAAPRKWTPSSTTRPAVNKDGLTHHQAKAAGMNIQGPPLQQSMVPCPLDERVVDKWFTKPCLDMARSGVVDGSHLDFESYGFTAFDKLGDNLCYCDYCFYGYMSSKSFENKVEAAKRYEWLKDRGVHNAYLKSLRDRISVIYRKAAEKIRAIKGDFIFSAYPDFSPGEWVNSWRLEGVALGLHSPEAPFFVVDASHYWPNHKVPWWDSNNNAIRKLGMRHILGTWTGGLFGEKPMLDVSAEQWIYDAAISHDGYWVWFENTWGPDDMRAYRTAHRRIRATERKVGDFLFKGRQDHTFVTTVEQSGNPVLGRNIISRSYHLDNRHLMRINNVNTDIPVEVRVRVPRLSAGTQWTVVDPMSDLYYTNANERTLWTSDELHEGIILSIPKRSELWLVVAPGEPGEAMADDFMIDPTATVSGAIMQGHPDRPPTEGPLPSGVVAVGSFPLAYIKVNPLKYRSSPGMDPVLGTSVHIVDAVSGKDKKLFGISGNCWSPVRSPDNKRIVFSCYVNGKGQIYIMNADGSSVRNISNNDFCDKTPQWSPDASQVVFVSDRDGDWEICVMKADGSDQRRLTQSHGTDRSPAFSPDGKTIAFESNRSGDFDIFLIQADGSNERVLLARSQNESEPIWSPDGKRIACVTGVYSCNQDIMVVDVKDGTVNFAKGLTHAATGEWWFNNVGSIRWSPNGKFITGAYDKWTVAWQGSGLFAVGADGKAFHELVAREPLKIYPGGSFRGHQMFGGWYFNGSASRRWLLYSFTDIQWSPDSKTIAFVSDMDPSGYHFFYTIPAVGGKIKRLDTTMNPASQYNKPLPIRGSSDASGH